VEQYTSSKNVPGGELLHAAPATQIEVLKLAYFFMHFIFKLRLFQFLVDVVIFVLIIGLRVRTPRDAEKDEGNK